MEAATERVLVDMVGHLIESASKQPNSNTRAALWAVAKALEVALVAEIGEERLREVARRKGAPKWEDGNKA